MFKIIEDNSHILINFADRTTNYLPFTFEGLGLIMKLNMFKITDNGFLVTHNKKAKINKQYSDETKKCIKSAVIIGKLFGKISDNETIYRTLGVRP